jgi:TonB family protein
MFKRLRFKEFVIVSLALHGLTVILMSLPKIEPKTNEISVEILDQIPVAPKQAVRPALKKPNDPQTKQLEKQIVEQEEKKTNEEAPDTRFLSAQNQRVEKQTIAKKKGTFQNLKKEAKSVSDSRNPRSWNLAPKLNELHPLDKEGLKKVDPQAESGEIAEKKSENKEAGSQTEDYVKDVDQGLETLLNAREFKYYSYYTRIRRQLTQHWEPKVRTKLSQMFKQGRYIASDTDKVTKLIVILDRGGNLVKVQVLKQSGVSDLDDAATESFRSAAPFPNPPVGIIEDDGTVKIRWDFVLES